MIEELNPTSIGYDPWTTEALAETLRSKGKPMEAVTGRQWVSACQTLLELLQTDRLRHPGREVSALSLASPEGEKHRGPLVDHPRQRADSGSDGDGESGVSGFPTKADLLHPLAGD